MNQVIISERVKRFIEQQGFTNAKCAGVSPRNSTPRQAPRQNKLLPFSPSAAFTYVVMELDDITLLSEYVNHKFRRRLC